MTTDPFIVSKALFEWWWMDEDNRNSLLRPGEAASSGLKPPPSNIEALSPPDANGAPHPNSRRDRELFKEPPTEWSHSDVVLPPPCDPIPSTKETLRDGLLIYGEIGWEFRRREHRREEV
jgi:hypothetical protein